ncbi:alanine--glyoxylate aminotransferase family protein [Schnuerera sp. xch1]|uniref:pyridoxal-phosphate-dependent aminotransferase family protein n=1 Tax=Schnuerera sp. xch1 TaxID=2874283 RepID=UPI001CC10FA6|nr:alanine--glyoxylate aminotransferase family protein [Schnuerera sp. xch1]MBZ2174138.1 alanine--glyoxylate aminotransferase family protein [Schnuerera sp. xch1]
MKNKKLVMIPGPTPVTRSIQDQMGRDTVAFGDPDFINDFKEVIKSLKEIFKTEGEAFIVAGTGTLAMEMGISNVVKEGDNVLVVSNGFFGDRYVELCERKDLNVDVLSAEWGTTVSASEIEKKLSEKNYKAITVTHVDTSTGVCAPVAEIGEVVKKFEDTILIVDGVCATAAEPEYLDEMEIDVLITGSQKAFGVAPGLAIVLAGPKAIERRKSLGTIRDYYIDFEKWIPIMNDPSKYFATPAVNMIWALQESLRIIKEEGIENRYERHIKVARAMQAALEELGFKILAEKEHRAVTLSNVLYMDGIDDGEFRKVLAEEGAVVAGGLGEYAGKMFRLGHMGNIDTHYLISTISAIERTLRRLGIEDVLGKGVITLTRELIK